MTEKQVKNTLKTIEKRLLQASFDDPDWEYLVRKRNQLLIKLEQLENPVASQQEEICSIRIIKP